MTDQHSQPAKGFGKAVRLASTKSFRSQTTRMQAGDPAYVRERRQARITSLVLHAIALAAFVLLSSWCAKTIAEAIVAPLGSFVQAAELFAAILLTFLGAFAFMRLAQALIRALFRVDDIIEWPRRDVDWGKQKVVFDRTPSQLRPAMSGAPILGIQWHRSSRMMCSSSTAKRVRKSSSRKMPPMRTRSEIV